MEPLLQWIAEISKPSVEPMPLHGIASVQPVTHRLKLAVGFSDASAAELAPISLTDALVSV